MKQKLLNFTQRYQGALRLHLKQSPSTGPQAALRLGHQAVTLGLETLDLARIHETVLIILNPANGSRMIKRAKIFFTEALAPIIETHHAARQGKMDLNQMNEALTRRTLELSAANRQLQAGIVRRKSVEAALKKSAEHYAKLLKDSLQLQEGLRQLTHHALASQEEERRNVSRELQDEVAQTLLGINVRLLSLKQEAKLNTKGLKNEIASTQRLVLKSARSVRRVARRYGSL